MGDVHRLDENWIYLGPGADASVLSRFTGPEWYAQHRAVHADDGDECRVVSMHTFTQPWDAWEMHPNGHEIVMCIDGEIVLLQERDGGEHRIVLGPGEYAINDPGVWHTADVPERAVALFITSGKGTDHKPR